MSRENLYVPDAAALEAATRAGFDLIVLVNPNSPTGRHVPREWLEPWLRRVSRRTRVWVDETYVDYVGPDQSVECVAAHTPNVVVCKSMSKVYALSGLRCAYLCGPPPLMAPLRAITPPWIVGLPAQVAAVRALADPRYYADCYRTTHMLRGELQESLGRIPGVEVVPGVANFLLVHLPRDGPNAAIVVDACRRRNVFLRDGRVMGSRLGTHALRVAVKPPEQIRLIVEAVLQASDPRRRRRHV